MKKNGFIATSVLYSFFIVFITLFVALIANFIHNRILIANVDEDSLRVINADKNTKISDLSVGDKVRFTSATIPLTVPGTEVQPASNLINDGSTWVVADFTESGTTRTYYFLSDMKIGSQFRYKRTNEVETRTHTITIDIFNEIKALGLYEQALLYNTSNPGKQINISIPTISVIRRASRNDNVSESIKNSIFNTTSNFTVYADTTIGSYTQGSYYNLRYYSLTPTLTAKAITNHCNSSFSSGKAQYNSSNSFGYSHVGNDAKKTKQFLTYCLYANPGTYTHNVSDKVVSVKETNITDKINRTAALGWDLTTNTSYEGGANAGHDIIGYNIRLMATITVDKSDLNTYMSGGKGTSLDPYLITDGQQKRYQSSKDKINLTSKALADVIMRKSNTSNIVRYTDGNQTEAYLFKHDATTGTQSGAKVDYRFIGNVPNNYIMFNNEVWRIIGVFNQDGESRVKIVRNQPLSGVYHSSKNDWKTSSIYTYLNNTYYNGLSSTVKNLIAPSTFYLGGSSNNTFGADVIYNRERGYTVYTGNSLNAYNYIGIPYVSDYLYTYGAGVSADCFNSNAAGKCLSQSWIYPSSPEYTMSIRSADATTVYFFNTTGAIQSSSVTQSRNYRPSLYLKGSIEVVSGTGAQTDPYIIK